MKRIYIIVIVLIVVFQGFTQSKFDPRIIVLSPSKVIKGKRTSKQVSFYEKYNVAVMKNYLLENKDSLLLVISNDDSIPLNHKEHLLNQINFASHLNFENKISQSIASSFQTFLHDKFDIPLVTVDRHISSISKESLKKYANNRGADYIISIDSLTVEKFRKDIIVTPMYSVYYQLEDTLVSIKLFDENSFNKTTLKSDNKSLTVFFRDVETRTEIVKLITNYGDLKSRENIYEQKLLKIERLKVLDSLFVECKDNKLPNTIIEDSILKTKALALHTVMYSKDHNKLLAFFITEEAWEFQGRRDTNDMVTVIYGKKVNDSWEFEYVLYGTIKLDNRNKDLHVKESFIGLASMQFFKEGKLELNKEFWERELFKEYSDSFK